MATELPYLTVPRGLTTEVTLYLQAIQDMLLDLAGFRQQSRRAVRLAETLDWINSGKHLPEALSGTARDGETVRLGNYAARPVVIVSGFELGLRDGYEASVRIRNLRSDNGDWIFEAVCRSVSGEETVSGSLDYLAIGRRENA